MSSRRATVSHSPVAKVAIASCLLAPLVSWSQYPGQITKKSNETPDLRAVAVLEWTGEAGKPKACRIVPVTVFDGQKLQDGGIYMARPEPLSLAGEVEYQLKRNGKTIGLFDIKNSGQEQGSWVGYGEWKPMPEPKTDQPIAKIDIPDDDYSDKPVLHRKHHADDQPGTSGAGKSGGSGTSSSGTSSSSASSAPAAPDDPDRPKLHKHDSGDSSASTSPAPGSDHPAEQKAPDSGGESSSVDRPTIKKGKQKPPEDIGHVESLPGVTDPDRPKLKRGKSSGSTLEIAPSLMGLPPDMQQAVAVSDAKNHPDHPWSYNWANPDDEGKMKSQLEDLARTTLGLNTPQPTPPPQPKPAATRTGAHKAARPAPPEAPAPLEDEQFRVFELAYGSGATMVFTAHTDGPPSKEKFVTLVAQPDLYGNIMVLLKSVTDGAHLDLTPRMRLVDAVDAMADNRGELLFELRGDTSRQFALFRVLRGTAEKLFVSGGGVYGSASN